MKTINKNTLKFLLVPAILSSLIFSSIASATGGWGGGGGGGVTQDATFTFDVTYFANFTPRNASKPANMSDNIFVGTNSSPSARGHIIIPLTRNGMPIIDQDSNDNVPGIHISRKNGYVEVTAYGFNAPTARESIKADFNFTNANLIRVENSALHPYEKQGNGTCGINLKAPRYSNPANDQYSISGNSGRLCSITNIDADQIRIVYSPVFAANNNKHNNEYQPSQPSYPNLISNYSWDNQDQSGMPADWYQGGWGNNNASFYFPTSSHSGNGGKVTVTNYEDGDAKWYFKDVNVTPGMQYSFSDYYSSDTDTYVVARYTMDNGLYSYQYLNSAPASPSWRQFSHSFTSPLGAVSATVFHLISSNGTLSTDDESLTQN